VLSLVIIRYDSEIAGFSGQLGLGVCPQNQSGVANGFILLEHQRVVARGNLPSQME
jgi:hypothetical protein